MSILPGKHIKTAPIIHSDRETSLKYNMGGQISFQLSNFLPVATNPNNIRFKSRPTSDESTGGSADSIAPPVGSPCTTEARFSPAAPAGPARAEGQLPPNTGNTHDGGGGRWVAAVKEPPQTTAAGAVPKQLHQPRHRPTTTACHGCGHGCLMSSPMPV